MHSTDNKIFYFSVDLTYDECMAYYKGHYTQVQVLSDSGETIRFAAEKLRPFISSLGVRGRFRLKLAPQHKFISLEKIS